MNWKKKIIPLALLALFIVAISSCNRGVGCPNQFSIKVAEQIF